MVDGCIFAFRFLKEWYGDRERCMFIAELAFFCKKPQALFSFIPLCPAFLFPQTEAGALVAHCASKP
jgi:hypothetical protein